MPILKDQKGFTLVELAISLTVIGLLLAGILKGDELVANARVNQTVKQIQNYRSAMTSFNDTYNAIPGDFSLATTRIPNCSGNCANGNGDKWIPPGNGSTTTWPMDAVDFSKTTENSLFWYQLSAAGYVSLDPVDNQIGLSMKSPIATKGCAVVAGYSYAAGAYATGGVSLGAANGTYLFIQNCVAAQSTSASWAPGAYKVMTAKNAYTIDTKLDDGAPNTGDILEPGNYGGISQTAYLVTTTDMNTELMIKLTSN